MAETKTEVWNDDQLKKAAAVAKNHGLTLNEFLAIVKHESAGTMSPSITNSVGATGIIQFMPSTAADLLLKEQRAAAMASATTPEAEKRAAKDNPLYWQLNDAQKKKANEWAKTTISKLPVDRQLELTDLYLSERTKGKKGVDAVYTAIFTGKPDTQVLEKGTQAYKNNAILDKNKDGKIAKDEWMVHVKGREAEVQAWLNGKEYQPDDSVSKRTAAINKALQDKAATTNQTPAQLPQQSEARAITAPEFFGALPKPTLTAPEGVDLMASLNKTQQAVPTEQKAPVELLSTKPTDFTVDIIEAYGPKKDEDKVGIITPFG